MVNVDFGEARDRTLKVVSRIEELTGKNWGPQTRFIDLVEEVGELANAILIKENLKHEKRKRSDVADSLSDIIYEEMLDELEKRVENKEFSD